MLRLLQQAADDGTRPGLSRHGQRLLTAATSATSQDQPRPLSAARAALADPLSDREVEVLRLLDSALTGPEIAGQLYVSLNTFRTHTKRIFTKLDVTSRAAAVHRGRELNLL
jgi:LuxR family maltose regulon positive regulatory protein